MKLKKFIDNIFQYKPEINYDFTLMPNEDANNCNNTFQQDDNQKIFQNLDTNLEYIKTKFNTLINSDIVIRSFILNCKNKQYDSFLIYIDGMTSSSQINDFILNPLMLKNKNNIFDVNPTEVISESTSNNTTIRKIKKFDLDDYIYNCLIPQNNVKKITDFKEIISDINSGNCALFIDTLSVCYDIDIKSFQQRSISSPNNEIVIRGPQEAFVENIRTNTSMIRRIINNENLIIENIEIGDISKTKCAICYLENITNNDLVSEVKYRLNNISIDTLLSSGQLEQLIEDSESFGIPQIISTERPDKSCKYLLQGRVIVLVNGNPYSLIMPATLIDFLSSPEDTNIKPIFANFLKFIRILAGIITLLLPGMYVAVTSFHQEILPTELLFSILAAREKVPFPIIFELLIMEFSFELIREAGLRVPSPIGPTIGIVGALVLGEAAVNANIVSPILIIVVAITGIASFAIPEFSFGFHLRIFRFIFILLGFISGFLGIGLGITIYITMICNIQSFGVPYTAPFAPTTKIKGNGYFIPPIWKQEFRANFLSTKKEQAQNKISMKWKYTKGDISNE